MRPQREIGTVLTAGVVDRVRDAHARWESDCLALDQQLTDAGLTFGATGYKLAVERGSYRLVEGVTLALDYLRGAVSRRRPEWAQAHDAILEAVDRHFLASSRLIPAPEADPVLQVALRTIREQVVSHCDHAPGPSWPRRLAAAIARINFKLG